MAAAMALAGMRAAAAAPPVPDDYQHTAWTAADGAPPHIASMAQTPDGWLWLGTADGLFRFDGMRFERFALPPGPGLRGDRIISLCTAPNGDLYVGFFAEGLEVVHPDGQVDRLPLQAQPLAGVISMAADSDGSLWTFSGDIRHFRAGRWEMVEQGREWRASDSSSMLLDARGQLWVADERGTWRLERASGRFVRMADAGGELLTAPDGRLWLVDRRGAARVLADAGAARLAAPRHADSSWIGMFDRAGALWRLNCPETVCLAPDPARAANAARPRARADRATVDEASAILADREGDIWVASEGGLERFRRKRLRPGGLPGSGARYSLASDGAGQMWAADRESGQLWRLPADGPPERDGSRPVSVIARGRDGALLVADRRSIERRTGAGKGAGRETIALPPGADGKPRDHHVLGILDDGKVLWTATLETGLIGWRDGRWWPRSAFHLPPKIYQSAPAGPGQLWLATGDGVLVFYDNDTSSSFDIRAIGAASAIFPGAPLTIGGNAGFGVLWQGRLRLLHGADPDALRNVSGMVVTPDGDRWLNGAAGLVHVRAADWRRSMNDPDLLLRYELFGAADGYPGQAAIDMRWPSAMSADGRVLWLAATGGVVRLDTAALQRNPVAPQAAILDVGAGKRVVPARGTVVLPPGGGPFRVQFTAPALHMPERLRFEYRLDGFDRDWLDAGARRATTYANVGPGDYLFRVRAFNEDGVAGSGDASVRLRIEPTMTQTRWFKLACAGLAALLAVLLYRYRVRYLTARLTERLQVRTAERERIARTLHDTFLQTVQGLVLRVDAVAAALPSADQTRRQLERVLDDAGHAIREGRAQLQELRAGDVHLLEDVVVDAVNRLRDTYGWMAAELRIEGERRALVPAVSEEVAEILREALRNAFAHSGGSQVRVAIQYGARRLVVRISDDGRGMDDAVRRGGGRNGHWGLVGMRERAARMGASLEIDSGRRQGTTLSLGVPGACAYAPGQASVPLTD